MGKLEGNPAPLKAGESTSTRIGDGRTVADNIAVITGGSSGSGLATAKGIVEEGAHLVITGRREKELNEAAAFIERNVTTVAGDVTRLGDLDRPYAVVKEEPGHIDFLCANAAIGEVGKNGETTEEHFDTVVGLNTVRFSPCRRRYH